MKQMFFFATLLLKYTKSSFEGHVMQGGHTTLQRYPHQVMIEISPQYSSICGGSILNQVIVLTAAHCFHDIDRIHSQVVILHGSERINKLKAKSVKSFMVHKNFDYQSMYADIALVRCKHPFVLGDLEKRVVIMAKTPHWNMGYISGWGVMNKVGDLAEVLKHSKQKIHRSYTCSKVGVPYGAFCAGPFHGPGYPAIGDSGGALIVNRFIQIGVASFKLHDHTLAVYTNVSYYYGWIQENAMKLYC